MMPGDDPGGAGAPPPSIPFPVEKIAELFEVSRAAVGQRSRDLAEIQRIHKSIRDYFLGELSRVAPHPGEFVSEKGIAYRVAPDGRGFRRTPVQGQGPGGAA